METADASQRIVVCNGCGRSVTLTIRPLSVAETAWREFDCPHCQKPNVIRLAGHILAIRGEAREI